jgi:hypothetical protein
MLYINSYSVFNESGNDSYWIDMGNVSWKSFNHLIDNRLGIVSLSSNNIEYLIKYCKDSGIRFLKVGKDYVHNSVHDYKGLVGSVVNFKDSFYYGCHPEKLDALIYSYFDNNIGYDLGNVFNISKFRYDNNGLLDGGLCFDIIELDDDYFYVMLSKKVNSMVRSYFFICDCIDGVKKLLDFHLF